MLPEKKAQSYHFNGFAVDAGRRLLLCNGQPVALNPKAFDLLMALVENHGQVMTKGQLLELVWPGQFVEEGNLTVHMSAVRKALGERREEHRYIVTVPGRGYQFVADLIDDNRGFVVEEHTISRITSETKEEFDSTTLDLAAKTQLAPAALNRLGSRRATMFMVGLATLSVLLLAGYWLSRRNDRPKARVLAVSVRQLTADGNVEFASLSADGRYFVYDSYRDSKESLWVANVAGGNPVQVQPPKNIQIRSLAFAPDGNTIFYVADGTLYRSPVTPGAAQKVLDGIVNFSISPDGRQIAVVRADSDRATSTIVISNLDGTGLPHELASLPLRNGYSPYSAWSPDGAMLAIGAVSQSKPTQMALMGVRIADGATNQLTPQLWSSIGKVAWLRDNSGLVLDATVEQSYFRIWLIDYPSGEARCITNDAAHYGRASVSISNDGASLLAVRDESSAQIWISPAADLKKAQQITSSSLGKLDGNEGLTWAPDGRIVYSSFFNDSYSLWIMNVDGSGARQLTSAGFNDQLPQVTSDGRYIVFQSDRGGGSDIWRVNLDGSDMKQLTNSGRSAWPDLTPDGKWIIYVARDAKVKTIQKISIDGGTPIRMLAADLPSVSPDGKLLAATYLDEEEKRTRLAVFLIEGGEALSHFSIPASATFNGGLRWLPDGSAVVYRDYRDGLWAQKISGGAPEKLAGLPNKKIRYFDWSSDGRQFAMSYGEEVRDVVLISNFR